MYIFSVVLEGLRKLLEFNVQFNSNFLVAYCMNIQGKGVRCAGNGAEVETSQGAEGYHSTTNVVELDRPFQVSLA